MNMTGEYYSDTFNFGGKSPFEEFIDFTEEKILFTGVQLQAQQFLVANTTLGTLGVGLMGVGLGASFFNNIVFSNNITYADNTNSTNNQTTKPRPLRAPNIIDQMAAQGVTNSRAFGLSLRDGTEGD